MAGRVPRLPRAGLVREHGVSRPSPNTTLDVTVTVNPGSSLNFNSAFSIFYNNRRVVDFPPQQTTSVNVTSEGSVQASSIFGGNQFPAQLAVDGLRGTSLVSAGPGSQGSTTFLWTGRQDNLISSIAILSNELHDSVLPPQFWLRVS